MGKNTKARLGRLITEYCIEHKVTITQLSQRTQIEKKRIRQILEGKVEDFETCLLEEITYKLGID